MTQHLSALTWAVFAAWAGGCLLLLVLMLVPRFRPIVQGLWPLMASELLIICIGLLPWQLPDMALGLVLALAGLRIGYEAGHVYGLKDYRSYAWPLGVVTGVIAACIWWLPALQGWAAPLALLALGAVAAIMALPQSLSGLGRFMLYPALPFAAFVVAARMGHAGVIVLTFLFVELFDSFSLLGGKLFGRHLLAPRISPRKTWEGFSTGLTMLMASSVIVAWLLRESVLDLVAAAIVVAIGALAGDLIASAIKRRSGVKDYPTVIPVQGGLLDIIDAWIVAAPLAVAVLAMLG